MDQPKVCLSCMKGTIINGVCNYCGRPEKRAEDRPAYALAPHTMLHHRYMIGDVLGAGGFGITYAAWDTKERHRLALKELYPASDLVRTADGRTVEVLPGQEQFFSHVRTCFQNEAKILIKLQGNPGILGIYHLFEENQTVYYTMEYLDGADLKTRLNKHGIMKWEELAPIVRALLPALDLLHSNNLIHRDISPDNIFLLRGGGVRLIDFGSVRTYQGARGFTTFMKHNFAPWEQYQSHGRQGPWTDLYALNVTLYYALTGKLPPKAPDRQLNDTVRPLSELCPQLPQHVAMAIQKGMAVSIEARYSNVRDYAQALFPYQPVFPTGGGSASGQGGSAAPRTPAAHVNRLICCSGVLRGQSWVLRPGVSLHIGRQPSCEVRYPSATPGVSGNHCTITMDAQNQILLRDESSRYGTWLGTNRLKPGIWYLAPPGSVFLVGQEQYRIQ